jgi:hypothetical protein
MVADVGVVSPAAAICSQERTVETRMCTGFGEEIWTVWLNGLVAS